MPRKPTFEPKRIFRSGKDTGRWRIFIPDDERTRVSQGKVRKGGREVTFDDYRAAESYGNELRAKYEAKLAGLALSKPEDALRFKRLKHDAMRLGYDSPEALIKAVENLHALNPAGPSLGSVLDDYAEAKRRNWTAKTRSTWETCTRPFLPLRHQKAHKIESKDWERFFNNLHESGKYATSTFNRAITYLRAAYEHAIHNQLLRTNPILNIQRVRPDLERDPVIVKAPQIRSFLSAAVDHHPETVPYWVAVFFAGVRPDSEALRLKWRHVLWDRGELLVPKPDKRRDRTKTRRARYVELEPVLRAWLELFWWEGCDGELLAPVSSDADKAARALISRARVAISRGHYSERDAAGDLVELIPWGSENRDLTRHTYATAFSKAHAGEADVGARLKTNLGHTTEETAERYYKNPHMTEQEARAIFRIFPTAHQKKKIAAHLAAA